MSVVEIAHGFPVSFDRDHNSFVVHLDKLTGAHLQERKLTVRVKNEHSRWVDLTLDLTGFDTDIKRRFAGRASEMARLCDPTEEMRKSLSLRYKNIFGRYIEDFKAMQALVRSSPASAQIPQEVSHPFAQFFSEGVVARDITIRLREIRDGGERREGVPELAGYESIQVHKFVLVASSEVFKRMFQAGGISNLIEIEGSSVSAMKQFVKYLYTQSITFANDKEAWEIYRLADRFQVDRLKALSKTGYCKEAMRLFELATVVRPKEFDHSLESANAEQMVPIFKSAAARISAFYKEVSDHMLI